MRNLLKKITSIPKRSALVIGMALILTVPASVMAAWGPERPVFDWNNTAQRGGSMTGPVFNSFINTPTYGDERNFVTASPAGTSAWTGTVNATSGQEVELRAFIHNNANESLNAGGTGVARNTRVKFTIPSGQANGFDVTGTISADNATSVYDTAAIKNDSTAFSLSYVAGSARLYNNGPFTGGTAVSDDVVGANGALIGYDAMNGNLPGCFDYTAVVIIKVKVNTPGLQLTKGVTKLEAPAAGQAQDSIKAKLGEEVTWRIDYKNVGTDRIDNVTIRDSLPAGLTLIPGSVTVLDASRPNGMALQDTALTSGGVDVGSYTVNGNGVIRFRTSINKDYKACEITNVAFGKGKNVGDVSDSAKVIIEGCVTTTGRLPKTGAGSVMGIVGLTTIAGALAHRYIFGRKFEA